jgi:hypothetical protein
LTAIKFGRSTVTSDAKRAELKTARSASVRGHLAVRDDRLLDRQHERGRIMARFVADIRDA